MSSPSDPSTVTRDELLSQHIKGGFLWTRVVSQRIGAIFALPAARRGVHPSTVTLASLVVGVVAPVVAIVLLPDRRVVAGVIVFVGWQLAYGLDCADGQIARATGRSSVAGARLDLTVDYAVYTVLAATLFVASEGVIDPVLAIVAGFAHAYQLFDEASGRAGDAGLPTVERSGIAYEVLGTVRDGGVQRAAAAVCVAIGPWPSAWALLALGGLGALQFLARTVALDRRSR